MAYRDRKPVCKHITGPVLAVCFVCALCVRLTGLQPVHVLQSDDVSFVEVEQSPVLGDVVPHRHHVL